MKNALTPYEVAECFDDDTTQSTFVFGDVNVAVDVFITHQETHANRTGVVMVFQQPGTLATVMQWTLTGGSISNQRTTSFQRISEYINDFLSRCR